MLIMKFEIESCANRYNWDGYQVKTNWYKHATNCEVIEMLIREIVGWVNKLIVLYHATKRQEPSGKKPWQIGFFKFDVAIQRQSNTIYFDVSWQI